MTFSQSWFACRKEGIEVHLHIQTNAKKSEVVGLFDNRLKIKIHALPQEGRANAALIKFLSELTGLPRASIKLKRGDTSKKKTVLLNTLDETLIGKLLLTGFKA